MADRKKTQAERDTDTAMHEQEIKPDRRMPEAQLEKLRDRAEALGVPRDFVQR